MPSLNGSTGHLGLIIGHSECQEDLTILLAGFFAPNREIVAFTPTAEDNSTERL